MTISAGDIAGRIKARLRQAANVIHWEEPETLDWVLIYGLPRAGTTYTLRQCKSIARKVVSDWELQEFREPIERADERSHVALRTDRLLQCMRRVALVSAPPGFGRQYEAVVKQHSISKQDYEFLVRIMGSEPQKKLFLYREPHGWRISARKKFGWDDDTALERYSSNLRSYYSIGGVALEYSAALPAEIARNLTLDESMLESWVFTSNTEEPNAATSHELVECYRAFCDVIRGKPRD